MQLLLRALDLQALCSEILVRQMRRGMGMEVLAMHRVLRLLPSLEQGPPVLILAQICYPHHLQDQQQQAGFVPVPVPPLQWNRDGNFYKSILYSYDSIYSYAPLHRYGDSQCFFGYNL